MGKVFQTLSDLKREVDRPAQGTGEPRFFTIKDGESYRIRFRQELTGEQADGTDVDPATFLDVHVSPADYRKKCICTGDEENDYKCWACEQTAFDNGWKKKQHLLINVAVFNEGEDKWEPRVLDQKFTSAHCADQIVEFALEYGTLLDRDYKISRKGTKQSTNYTIMPLAEKPADESIADLALHDPEKNYKSVPYAAQQAFFLSENDSDGGGATGWTD